MSCSSRRPIGQPDGDGGHDGQLLLQVQVRPRRPHKLGQAFQESHRAEDDRLRSQRSGEFRGLARSGIRRTSIRRILHHQECQALRFRSLLLRRTDQQWHDARIFAP